MQKSTSSGLWLVFTAVMISILVVFAMFTFSACRALKRHTKTTIIKDSTVSLKDTSTLVKISNNTLRTRVTQDSAIGIPGTWIKFITINGSADTAIRKGALQLKQYRNQAGHLVTECSSDSLTLVIQRLIRDSVVIQERYDSIARQMDYQYKNRDKSVTDVKVYAYNWKMYIALLVVLSLAYIVYKVSR